MSEKMIGTIRWWLKAREERRVEAELRSMQRRAVEARRQIDQYRAGGRCNAMRHGSTIARATSAQRKGDGPRACAG